jgi:hypothetical protein
MAPDTAARKLVVDRARDERIAVAHAAVAPLAHGVDAAAEEVGLAHPHRRHRRRAASRERREPDDGGELVARLDLEAHAARAVVVGEHARVDEVGLRTRMRSDSDRRSSSHGSPGTSRRKRG